MASLPTIWEPLPTPSETPERRGSARSPLFTLVSASGVREPMWASDIGLGGMQCRSREPRWPGTYMDLSFNLPGTNENLEVGGQVLTLDQLDGDRLSLGLKFCMLSARDQRTIYRFLDQRRALWFRDPLDNQARRAKTPRARVEQWVADQDRPFEPMLLEAYAQLRQKELDRLAFVRAVNRADLPHLSDLVR